AAADVHVAAGLGVDAVGVRGVGGVKDPQPRDGDLLAEGGVHGPCRGVAQGHVAEGHPAAFVQADQGGAGMLEGALALAVPPRPAIVPRRVIAASSSPCAYRHGEWTGPVAPSQRAWTTGYSAGSGTKRSTAPASRCSSPRERRRSAPVRWTPAGTTTRPPPRAAASSISRCRPAVAGARAPGSSSSRGGLRVTGRAFPVGGGGVRAMPARGARPTGDAHPGSGDRSVHGLVGL